MAWAFFVWFHFSLSATIPVKMYGVHCARYTPPQKLIHDPNLFDLANRPPHGFPHGLPQIPPPGFRREIMIPHEGMLPPFDMGKIIVFVCLKKRATRELQSIITLTHQKSVKLSQ